MINTNKISAVTGLKHSILLWVLCLLAVPPVLTAQASEPVIEDSKPIVDKVWLKDGSTVSGAILKWELAGGMEFKLS